ncbi:Serpentine receptor class T-55 [Caenorhabditis elegans]|uniref:Serpentine receptor class T-55 n=1 Tax=Caenorhabditis elegans TaxID=6239 RepID=SRT55_CAEEL|nr:Serpentine receptor class T-55 [Caenorhabditis elegans]P34571.1 RecName: Full=Serpentine receptor class T-55; Short=Protein srt-55; Flags: Precursor [Caenorhabditis elegans]CAA83134.1 Serpentine receptor class T-55 [Caenorhabditis elegans]|eukprot:NP_499243.1 Serpentine receptor class T-55 [Caenorhabditis elegans]
MKLRHFLIFLMLIPISSSICFDLKTLQCWPMEIQEMALMLTARNTARYDCSGKSKSEWYETGQKRLGWGIYYISSGLFFQLIGWPVIWVFITKFSMTNALKVYRIMVFIGLIEITEIWGNSVFPGFVAVFGEVYCTSPILMTIVGKMTMVQWVLGSSSAAFLGFHRLCDMIQKLEWLVNTNTKTGLWLTVLFFYACYGSIFFDTVLFNSDYMAPLLDPMIGKQGIIYSNNFLYFHNIIVATTLILVYACLCTLWSSREMNTSSLHVSKFQRSILLQSICISLTYAIPAISFVTMFVLPIPKWFFHVSDITYQLSGGLPFIMYICLNKRVREEFLHLLRVCRKAEKSQVAVIPLGNSTVSAFNN